MNVGFTITGYERRAFRLPLYPVMAVALGALDFGTRAALEKAVLNGQGLPSAPRRARDGCRGPGGAQIVKGTWRSRRLANSFVGAGQDCEDLRLSTTLTPVEFGPQWRTNQPQLT